MSGPFLSLDRSSPGWPWFTGLAVAVAAGLWLLMGPAPQALVFDREAVAGGEVWRLVSGHLVHSDGRHALWDIAALAVIGGLMEELGRQRLAIAFGTGLLAVNACLWWGMPELERYCGLSGLLNALVVVALADRWRLHRHPIFPLAGLLLGLKLAAETAVGQSVLLNPRWPGVPLAHVAGCLGGFGLLALEVILISTHPCFGRNPMNRLRPYLPTAATLLIVGAALAYGPVAQLPNYHAFADQRTILGIPHFADVLSNAGFILVALWGGIRLYEVRRLPDLAPGWAGYRLFLLGLFLTGFGSAFYHLAPDNGRLIWDRLPIALACAGLLAGVWGDSWRQDSGRLAAWLAIAAVASVAWWQVTDGQGAGDLRPYLLLQALPLVLIPLWQWIHGAEPAERRAFGGALALYGVAKLAELYDHEIASVLGVVTGHTLKHLIATLAAILVVRQLVRRVRPAVQSQLLPIP